MVNKDIVMVMKNFKRDGDKHISDANLLHNARRMQKRIYPLVPDSTKQRDKKWNDIPYEKLIVIAELLK